MTSEQIRSSAGQVPEQVPAPPAEQVLERVLEQVPEQVSVKVPDKGSEEGFGVKFRGKVPEKDPAGGRGVEHMQSKQPRPSGSFVRAEEV